MRDIHNRPLCYSYQVMSWADAEVADRLVEWLVGSHVAEVLQQDGMIAASVVRLSEESPSGQIGILCSYQLRTRCDLDAYLASAAKARFNAEGSVFEGRVHTVRSHGAQLLNLATDDVVR